jgi:hypothetical protein
LARLAFRGLSWPLGECLYSFCRIQKRLASIGGLGSVGEGQSRFQILGRAVGCIPGLRLGQLLKVVIRTGVIGSSFALAGKLCV